LAVDTSGCPPYGQSLLDLLGLFTTAAHRDKIVCLCRVPDYAESLVKVLDGAVHLAAGSA
jgi:hypothetical protein